MKKHLQTLLLLIGVLFGTSATAQYCVTGVGPSSTADSEITNVLLPGDNFGISNLLTCPGVAGVADYTATDSADLSLGTSYTLSVTFGTCGGVYSGFGRAWIDFNGDGDFTDAGEDIGVWTGSPLPQNSTMFNSQMSFTVPLTATQGTTRMRVRQNEGGTSATTTPCSSSTWGAVEDYTIVITNTPPPCPIPGSIVVSNILATSASVSWTSTGTAFDIEYGPTGFVLGTGTSTTSTLTNKTLTGLTANTTYDVYVRNNCTTAGNGTSGWSFATTFTTPCNAVNSYPYSENFDGSTWSASAGSSSTPGTTDNCWSRDQTGSVPYWIVHTGGTGSSGTGPSAAYSSANYMYMETSGGAQGNSTLLYLPAFDLSTLTTPLFSFYYHMYGATMGNLIVEVSTDTGSTWTAVLTKTGQDQLANADPWKEDLVDLTNYKTSHTLIRFKGVRGSSFTGDMAIDNVKIEEAPPCPKPTAVNISNISSSTAVLNFLSNGTSFPFEWGPTGFTQGTGNADTATATGHVITGLPANSLIDVWVLNDCSSSGNGLSVWTGPFTFRTLCTGFAEGYFENFDALNSGSKDPCWADLSYGGHTVYALTPSSFSAVQAYSTPNVYYWYNAGSTWSYIMTPELVGLDGDSTQIKVRMANNYFSATPPINVFVGTMSDRADTSTITWHDTITPAHQVWNQYTVLFNNVPTGDKFVVFGRNNATTFSEIDIDNFRFEGIPACLPPTNHTVVVADLDSISLTWTGGTNAISNIEYGPCGFTQGTGTQVSGALNGSATFNNLNSGTCYDFYIQNDCGNGVTSPWYGPFQVSTLVCASTSQCAYKFVMYDSFGDGWNGARMTVYQNNIALGTMGSTFLTGNWDTAYVNICDMLSTDLIVTAAGSYPTEVGVEIFDPFGISVYKLTNGFPGITNGQVLSTFTSACTPPSCPDPQNLTAGFITGFTADISWTAFGSNHQEFVMEWGPQGFVQGSGMRDTVTTTMGTITGLSPITCYDVYVLGVCGSNGNSSWSGPLSFCTLVSCPAPTNLALSSAGQSSATMTWNTGSASSWNYVNVAGGMPPSAGTVVYGATNPTTVTGLAPGSAYSFYVRDSCGPGDVSAWTGPLNYTTPLCDTSQQCDFKVLMYDSFGDGWNGFQFSIVVNGVTFNNIGNSFLTGTLDSTTFKACNGYPVTVKVATVGFYPTEVSFDIINDQGVTVLSGSNFTSASANATVGNFTPNCLPISCPAPTNPMLVTSGLSSATFSWTTGSASTWNYVNVPQGQAPSSGSVVFSATNPSTVTGLTPGTAYSFYVRDSCGLGDVSNWAGPVNYVTPLCDTASQCDFDVYMYDSFGDGWNGFEFDIEVGGIVWGTIGSTFTTGSSALADFQACNGIPVTIKVGAVGSFPTEVSFDIVSAAGDTVVQGGTFSSASQGATVGTFTPSCLPTCVAPTNFAATNVACDSLSLSWTTDPATFFSIIQWDTAGFTPGLGAGNLIISPVGNYNLSGLMPGASYDFYLVDSCALGISPPAFLNVTTPTAPLPVIGYSATQTATTMSNAVVTFDASNSANYTSIKWEFGDGTPDGTNALEAHTYTMNQSYTVTLTLTNGCGSVDSTFTVNVMGIGLDETEIGQTLSIFPNPTDGKFNVAFEVTDNQDITIRVMDAIGRAVLVKDLGNVNGAQNVSLDLSNNASGIYMVQIVTDEGTITKRLTLRNK